ncbi:MAG: hypothetical protein D6710_09770 [Nitrospirae bacterium]|nr:MAG: hypothetical protein D6710_09770 [Nitrospirota bacterium]
MIFEPSVIAQLLSSLLMMALVLYCSYWAYRITRHWNPMTGSELQISLERRTYLISTMLKYVFVFEVLSVFLFLYTAERIHNLFVGAMCAAGTLNVNQFGYPLLLIKLFNFFLAGLWLIINYFDQKGFDYPLLRVKYRMLMIIAPFMIAETVVGFLYFTGLKPDIITSCCGTLFSLDSATVTSELSSVPAKRALVGFYLTSSIAAVFYVLFFVRKKCTVLIGLINLPLLVISIITIISAVSIYLYELPTHHCPFCMLQSDVNFIGYPLYISLFGSVLMGMGLGLTTFFKDISSIKKAVRETQIRMAKIAFGLLLLFNLLVSWIVVSSELILE